LDKDLKDKVRQNKHLNKLPGLEYSIHPYTNGFGFAGNSRTNVGGQSVLSSGQFGDNSYGSFEYGRGDGRDGAAIDGLCVLELYQEGDRVVYTITST
jgi:hypothetical protein